MYYSAGLYTQATEMAIQAANKGEPFTQFLLAKIYEQGLGVAQDKDKAAYWAKQSAAQGYYPGICVLGRYYLTGTGVQQDLIEADKWFILSSEPNAINGISTDFADDSLRGYKHIRTVLESQMPPKDVIEAKMRAARWKPAKH
jgi:TPR repeat protein